MSDKIDIIRKVIRDGLASGDADSKNLSFRIIKEFLPISPRYFDEIDSIRKAIRDGLASGDADYKNLCLEIILEIIQLPLQPPEETSLVSDEDRLSS